MMLLVGFVSISVFSFASRYFKGDSQQKYFYLKLFFLTIFVFLMVSADHILLMLTTWLISNFILARLMLHKSNWKAAKASYLITLKNFTFGFLFLGSAFIGIYSLTGETSIQAIIHSDLGSAGMIFATLILLTAMTQSALFPFHGWLIGSLNSPTPVSAIMHAGLVNGGGFILTRFAPIFLQQPFTLNIIFILGIATALIGILWKLMQHDIKRMLACSTMGQMGFMIAQCGLGLFPAAVSHLCWHGLCKSYLFLASGSTAQEKRFDLEYPPKFTHFILALIYGILAAYIFAKTSDKNLLVFDTSFFFAVILAVAGAQFALPIIRKNGKLISNLFLALIAITFMSACYGLSVHLIESMLEGLNLWQPQPLNLIHIVILAVLTFSWLGFIFFKRPKNFENYPSWVLRLYVLLFNSSQPNPKTITAHRNHYQY